MNITINIDGTEKELQSEIIKQLQKLADVHKCQTKTNECKIHVFGFERVGKKTLSKIHEEFYKSEASTTATCMFYHVHTHDCVCMYGAWIYYSNKDVGGLNECRNVESCTLERLLTRKLSPLSNDMVCAIIQEYKYVMDRIEELGGIM